MPVTVNFNLAGNTYTWRGTLSRVDGSGLDERTRTVPCLEISFIPSNEPGKM